MAAAIRTAQEPNVGTPLSLFKTTAGTSAGLGTTASYDVTADGQRFIVASSVNASNSQPINVSVNWIAAALTKP